ncbi:MAG: RNA methyltransferase [Bacilli bacterium]|nr:RNA methyltransferase [Bacilli bacterium]
MKIESLQNKKVKEWQKLKEKKYRDQNKCFLIEGDHLLKEALKKDLVLEIISINSHYANLNLPFFEVTPNILQKISQQKSIPEVIAICKKIESHEISGSVCILDGIQDPGNLGTIIRSAIAFHVETLILSKDTVDIYNEKVLRATEGMIFHINFIREDLDKIIPLLKQQKYKIYGTDVQTGIPLNEVTFSKKKCIIIGNEGNGMKEKQKKECDSLIHIPINPECESLNAAIATSIIFYEMNRSVGIS